MFNLRVNLVMIVLFLSVAAAASAQPDPEWVARFNGAANDEDFAVSMAMDVSGNIYVTGDSYQQGSFSDYATVKYDIAGNQLWAARYSGSESRRGDHAAAMAVDKAGNVHVTGYSMGTGTGFDYATVKYDGSGKELWTARYNSPVNEWDLPKAIAVDDSGNVYVTGYSPRLDTGYDYATIKYDPEGRELWVARYDHGGLDQASALALDSAGHIYVAGSSRDADTGSDYATVKYDPNGKESWAARYNSGYGADDHARAMAVGAAGNIHVTGYSRGAASDDDYLTVKYDALGNLLWAVRYNGSANTADRAEALAVDIEDCLYVTGYSRGRAGTVRYATVKYDPDGNQIWVRNYDSPINEWDHAESLAVDDAGHVYVSVVGRSADSSYDYIVLGYDGDGNELPVFRYNGPDKYFADHARDVMADKDGYIYVLGYSWGVESRNDYTLIKYRPIEDSSR